MDRRHDDYNDGHERLRQAPYGRSIVESFEEPGAETPGPPPVNSAFAPIGGRDNFMPVVVPQPLQSGQERSIPEQSNQRQRDPSFPASSGSSSFHSQNDRSNIPRPPQSSHSGHDRRSTPNPLSDQSREIMPPPQLPARPAPHQSRDRVESRVVDHRNERPSTSSTTHNSIEPEFNRTPQLNTRETRDPGGFVPREGPRDTFEPVSGGHGVQIRSQYGPRDHRPESRSFSPDMQPGPSHLTRGGVTHHHDPNRDLHGHTAPSRGGHTSEPPPRDHYHVTSQHRSQSPYSSHRAPPVQSPNRGATSQQVYHRTMNHHPQAREQQTLGLREPAGEVHYGHSPMDDRYDDAYRSSHPMSSPTIRHSGHVVPPPPAPQGVPQPPGQPPPPPPASALQQQRRRYIVEVPMETEYAPATVVPAGSYVHSAPAQYSQPPPGGVPPPRSNAPPQHPTAYATHSANQVQAGGARDPRDGVSRDPSQLTLSAAPSANRVFSTRPQQLNEPLYSSLPPPSNQPNQVIQPQVAISPTNYHQPPQQSNIGFNYNQQQQPSQPHCQQRSCCNTAHCNSLHQPPQQQYNPVQTQHGGNGPYQTPNHGSYHNPGHGLGGHHGHYGQAPMDHSGQPNPPGQPTRENPAYQQRDQTRSGPSNQSRHNSPHRGLHRDTREMDVDSEAEDYRDDRSRRGDRNRRLSSSYDRNRRRSSRDQRNRRTPPRERSRDSDRMADNMSGSASQAGGFPTGMGGQQQQQQQQPQSSTQQQDINNQQLALTQPAGALQQLANTRATNELLSLSSMSQQLQMQGLNHTMASMLVPILKDQGVQQGCREMASSFTIQTQLNEMKQQMTAKYEEMQQKYQEKYQEKIDDLMRSQIIPTINSAIEASNKSNINDAPQTPQSCNSDRSQSRHPDLIRTPDSSVSGTYSDTDSPHSGGRGGARRGFRNRSEPYPTSGRADFNRAGDFPPSPNQVHRSGHRLDRGMYRHGHAGNSGGYSSAQSSPIDSNTLEDNFQPNSISPTQNQYSDLSVDQVCEKLQEWTQVSDDIIENFRRENIQGRHLNYLTEYMIKKGLLSHRTEQETPENVRPIAARLGPLKTVCRALKMHVGQAKELQTTSTEREAVGLGSMNAVCVWLRTIGLSEYDRRFSEEQVYGSALLDLSELNLIELGMDKLGDRITFMLQREMLN